MPFRDAPDPAGPSAALEAAGAVAAALGVAWLLHPVAGLENVDLVFLTAVMAVAARRGLVWSLAAGLASVLAYNFFFIPPTFTFQVADPRNVTTLAFFAIVAAITSHLAARQRAQAVAARLQARTTEALYDFSRRIAEPADADGLAAAAAGRMAALLDRDVVLLLPDGAGALRAAAASRPEDGLEDIELAVVQASWSAGDWAGRTAMRVGTYLLHPLGPPGRPLGLVALSREGMHEPFSPDEERLFAALADQVAAALDRIRLAAERDAARLAAEGERLRSALLGSLSHDLKTPLATITGAITALRADPDLYDDDAREELSATVQDEAERMTRFVTNLLDMTGLEAGALKPAREPVDLGDLAGAALARTARLLDAHRVVVDLEPDLPLLVLDGVLVEQTLVNLLDNAAKYAPPGTAVTVSGRRAPDGVELAVADEGPGLAPGELERIFDPFYRATRGDRQRAGTGLGLAIGRGFVAAMGGTIRAGNRADRPGAVFTLAFPASLEAVPPEAVA